MKTLFVLIVYFGAGHSNAFTVDHFDTKIECEVVRELIIDRFKNEWSGPSAKEVECRETKPFMK